KGTSGGGVLMKRKSLLLVTALVEGGTGLALLVTPSLTAELLLGTGLVEPAALVLGRVTGVALLAVGVACGLAQRDERSGAQTGMVAGLLLYNVGVPMLLIYAALVSLMQGPVLWPASVGHMLLAVWCVASLRSR